MLLCQNALSWLMWDCRRAHVSHPHRSRLAGMARKMRCLAFRSAYGLSQKCFSAPMAWLALVIRLLMSWSSVRSKEMKVPKYLKCAVKSMKELSLRRTRLVFCDSKYRSSLCFCVIVEKVSFLLLEVRESWLPLASVVSSEGFGALMAVGVGVVVIGRVGYAVLLKKDAVGKYISSVLDFFSPCPVCISSPSSLKVSFIISHPVIILSLVLNGKLPSSRYSMWVTVVVSVVARLLPLMLCPVSFPFFSEFTSRLQWLKLTLSIFAIVHFASSISAKAAMISRKITGDKLSPCLTLIVCGMVASSFPILSETERFE